MSAPDVVLLPLASGSKRKLHAPDPENPDDSLCRFNGTYRRKSRDAVEDHYEWCSYCEARLDEVKSDA